MPLNLTFSMTDRDGAVTNALAGLQLLQQGVQPPVVPSPGSNSPQPPQDRGVATAHVVVTDQRPAAGGIAPADDPGIFLHFCTTSGIAQSTLQTLLNNGINSITILHLLLPGDLDLMGIPLGQVRLIQSLVPSLAPTAAPTQPVVFPSAAGQQTAPVLSTVPPASQVQQQVPEKKPSNLSIKACRHLALGQEGEKPSYLHIRDYVTILKNEGDNEDEEGISLPDGSKFVKAGGSNRPKLDQVSPLQFMESSMRILGKFILNGSVTSLEQVGDYASHIAEVGRLGQKKDWHSVVRYDDTYRQAQAVECFAWGDQCQSAYDLYIEPKNRDKAKSPAANQRPSPGTGKYGKQFKGKGKTGKVDSADSTELRICGDFSRGTCRRQVCTFRHFCAECGSTAHGAKAHPN